MNTPSALSGDNPPAAGGALPAGRRLLGLVQRMRDTGMALARCLNRIARQRLEGQDLAKMAPAGFDATATNALVVQAVAWTAALRERLLAIAAVRPSFALASGLPTAERAPPGRGAAYYLPKAVPNPTEEDRHDWHELAKPLRIGPAGVAVALRLISGLSNREVVTGICGRLSTALVQLGAEADVARIAALKAAALALCPDADEAPDEAADSGRAADGPGARAAGPPADEPATAAEDDPPPKPPD